MQTKLACRRRVPFPSHPSINSPTSLPSLPLPLYPTSNLHLRFRPSTPCSSRSWETSRLLVLSVGIGRMIGKAGCPKSCNLVSEFRRNMSTASLLPGFRFRPTDEELVGYYLKRKVDGLSTELDLIPVVQLYKYEPWDLPGNAARLVFVKM
ncbi:hypothetical protein BHM03_00058998 [Ensete ventricosum]|nr:hypothetical protein BHM03_00058998 [Ensete ventricosum]